jgi:hypothetical protein
MRYIIVWVLTMAVVGCAGTGDISKFGTPEGCVAGWGDQPMECPEAVPEEGCEEVAPNISFCGKLAERHKKTNQPDSPPIAAK